MEDRSSAGSTIELNLSPSVNHGHLSRRVEPRMSFRGATIEPWRLELRAQLRRLVGLPEPVRPHLAVRTLWHDETPDGSISKIAFTAEEFADVVAYLCLPRETEPPYPTVICLQGHSTGMHLSIGRDRDDEAKEQVVDGDRDFGLSAMRHGFAALCVEQRSFGLRREQVQEATSSHGCHDAVMHALMLGRTLLGERVFDVDRAIDYLVTRPDIDADRIGVMGNSGGGTVSIYAAALLDRVAFAMPSCAFCTFIDSIMSIYHCGDNYVPGILQLADQPDILGLFAPKPLVVVTGKTDPLFPIAGVRSAFSRLQEIYAASDAPGNCRLIVGDGGHRFYEKESWPVLIDLIGGSSHSNSDPRSVSSSQVQS